MVSGAVGSLMVIASPSVGLAVVCAVAAQALFPQQMLRVRSA